jgi:predicted nucleic acid-binding protein
VRISTSVTALVDTNVLVYRFDPRVPAKQARANEVLRTGGVDGALRIAHQALVEFVAVVTRPVRGGAPLLDRENAVREVETIIALYDVLYPDEELVRLALRAGPAYGLSWFDAHMWAYAERHGLDELISEDFEHGRHYGTVRVTNPFADS